MIVQPSRCSSIEQVREQVDRIDRSLVTLLSERMDYAKRGAEIKALAGRPVTGTVTGDAAERLNHMVGRRRDWAESDGLPADLVESVFRHLVAEFLAAEARHATLSKD